jgi:hypothetical protein
MPTEHPFKIGEKVWVITNVIQTGKIAGYRRFVDGSLYAYAVDCGQSDFDAVPCGQVHASPASALQAISDNAEYWSRQEDEFCKIIEDFKNERKINQNESEVQMLKGENLLLRYVLKAVYGCATGEDQVCESDTMALEWIAQRTRPLIERA